MKSILLLNPSGREVFVADNRVPHLLSQGFELAPEPVAAPEPEPEEKKAIRLEDLDRAGLTKLAAERGIEHHPRLGQKKLRALLSE